MRRISRGEGVARSLGLAVVMALGACGTGGAHTEASPGASSASTTGVAPNAGRAAILGIIGNDQDSSGRYIGAFTYVGPDNRVSNGALPHAAQFGIECVAPGREIDDRNVPAGQPPVISKKYYYPIEGDGPASAPSDGQGRGGWVPEGYVEVTDSKGGTPSVPQCTPDVVAAANNG